MPKYTFVCYSCETSNQRHVPKLVTEIECPICKQPAIRQLPVLNGPSNVTEVINKYTGTTQRRDQKEEVEARKAEYYWTVEVPRFVASGTYTLETMLENGWVWVDDNLQVHTHTVPPHRR